MIKEIHKSYKIRLFPNKDQEREFINHIGACRFIWNYMLDLENRTYENGENFLQRYDLHKLVTVIKNMDEYSWLKSVSHHSLEKVCANLTDGFKNFFNKTHGYPNFKSKKSAKKSYPIRDERFYFINNTCNITKIGKVRFKSDIEFPQGINNIKISNGQVMKELDKWYLHFSIKEDIDLEYDYSDYESQVIDELPDKSLVGIDLGVKELATVAFNDDFIVYHNINKSKKMRNLEKRINYYQRSADRKYRTHKNWEKTKNIIKEEDKLRKLYKKQRDIRSNYIHQVTNDIVKMKPHRVVMEDLHVRVLERNKYLSKSIHESAFGTFIQTMKYKCEWNGIQFKQVPWNYPSSKTCSCCGNIKRDLKLNDRVYICSECGMELDRDMNAARNLMNYRF